MYQPKSDIHFSYPKGTLDSRRYHTQWNKWVKRKWTISRARKETLAPF